MTLTASLRSILLLLTLISATPRTGIDSFEIHCNGKVLLRQTITNDISIKSLSLDSFGDNDQLDIYYYQCRAENGIGKGRSITIRDAAGKLLKEWKFSDGSDSHTPMQIPVKELRQLARQNPGSELSFYYSAVDRPRGQALVSFRARVVAGLRPA